MNNSCLSLTPAQKITSDNRFSGRGIEDERKGGGSDNVGKPSVGAGASREDNKHDTYNKMATHSN